MKPAKKYSDISGLPVRNTYGSKDNLGYANVRVSVGCWTVTVRQTHLVLGNAKTPSPNLDIVCYRPTTQIPRLSFGLPLQRSSLTSASCPLMWSLAT